MSIIKRELKNSLKRRAREQRQQNYTLAKIRSQGWTYRGATQVIGGKALNFRDLKKRDGTYPTWEELLELFGGDLVGNRRSYQNPGYVTIYIEPH